MSITKAAALTAFETAATNWNNASLALTASGAVALIVAVFGEGEKSYAATTVTLREIVAGKGVKQSMMYRYIALSRDLVARFEKDAGKGDPKAKGPIADVLASRKPETAAQSILTYLEEHKVASLNDLAIFLGGLDAGRKDTRAGGAPKRTARQPTAPSIVGSPVVLGAGGKAPTPHEIATAVSHVRKPQAILAEIVETINSVDVLKDLREIIDARIATLAGNGRRKRSTAVETEGARASA